MNKEIFGKILEVDLEKDTLDILSLDLSKVKKFLMYILIIIN